MKVSFLPRDPARWRREKPETVKTAKKVKVQFDEVVGVVVGQFSPLRTIFI